MVKGATSLGHGSKTRQRKLLEGEGTSELTDETVQGREGDGVTRCNSVTKTKWRKTSKIPVAEKRVSTKFTKENKHSKRKK